MDFDRGSFSFNCMSTPTRRTRSAYVSMACAPGPDLLFGPPGAGKSHLANRHRPRQSGSKKSCLDDRHDHACATGRRFKARLPPFSSRLSRYMGGPIAVLARRAAGQIGWLLAVENTPGIDASTRLVDMTRRLHLRSRCRAFYWPQGWSPDRVRADRWLKPVVEADPMPVMRNRPAIGAELPWPYKVFRARPAIP